MHRSVLTNKGYMKFAAVNTVEVLTMEETDVAIQKESRHIRTFTVRDPYGDEEQQLVEFPGLTLEALQSLNNSPAMNYMQGNRIPYTAVVNPHTLEEMEGIRGTKNGKQLADAIKPHVKELKLKYGPGIARALWDTVSEGQVQIDIALAKGKIPEALGVWRHLAKETVRKPEALKERVESSLELILEDAGKALDGFEKQIADGKRASVRTPLKRLARALEGTPLEKRAAELVVGEKAAD